MHVLLSFCPHLMSFSLVFLFVLCLYICNFFNICTPPPPTPSPHLNNYYNNVNIYPKITHIETNNISQMFIFALGFFSLLWLSLLQLCNHVNFVAFNTNLCTQRKVATSKLPDCFWSYLSLTMLGLLFCECPDYPLLMFIISINQSYTSVVNFILKFRKIVSHSIFSIVSIYIYSIALSPATCILALMVFQIWCHSLTKNVPLWLLTILLLLSNDIHLNPGPHFQNNFFNFMSWNLNSLAKDNVQRIRLIEAHNTLFNYDLIYICETSLNDSVELPDTLLDDYTFLPANNPANVRHGGVGLLFKNSLPVIVRNDLSFDESIVIELKFGRKKIFFIVLYRSPAFNHNSLEFQAFLSNFKSLHSKIQGENPFAMFFTGDFNAHSQFWWPDGDSNPEGMEFENLFTSLGLSQIISEPTNFEPNKNPSCIDLIATDQPNLILDCGTRVSLDTYCHHQIIYCKVNFKIPPPPPFEGKIWHFNRANTSAIKRSMTSFPWFQHLNINTDPNWQVKTFTEIFLNIMSNLIPNETKRFVPRDPPWITKPLKTMLNRKNRLFKNYKKHRYKNEDKVRLEVFRIECQKAVQSAKLSYLTNMGNKVNDPGTSPKSYWKIINSVMNKCRAPKIPPLLINNRFILDCREKAKLFNDFFRNNVSLLLMTVYYPFLYF